MARHPGQPVWGHGWDDTAWPGEPAPSTAEIDAVVGTAPAYLARVDVHSAVASSALRDLVVGLAAVAGFDPQGPLSADAHHLVRRGPPLADLAAARRRPPRRARRRRRGRDRRGPRVRGPQIGGAEDWQEVRGTEHGVEVVGYWGEAVSTAAQARALIDATGAAGLAGDLFVDGALGSHTAWLC